MVQWSSTCTPSLMHYTFPPDDISQVVCISPAGDLVLCSSTLAPHR